MRLSVTISVVMPSDQKAVNEAIRLSREAGIFEVDDQSSRRGDLGRSPSSRFPLQTPFIELFSAYSGIVWSDFGILAGKN